MAKVEDGWTLLACALPDKERKRQQESRVMKGQEGCARSEQNEILKEVKFAQAGGIAVVNTHDGQWKGWRKLSQGGHWNYSRLARSKLCPPCS